MIVIPLHIRSYLTDKDRCFLNTINRELSEAPIEERNALLVKYKVINGRVIWDMTVNRKGRYRKLFKRYLEKYENELRG